MISKRVVQSMQNSSYIRRMFEEGIRLKQIHGAGNVYDFSLGNPDLEPPKEVTEALKAIVAEARPGLHSYMSNAGYPETRAAVAGKLSRVSGVEIPAANVLMTVGAAGAMNCAFHSLLDAGDEVVVLAPYFVDYLNYVANHGGTPVIVACSPGTFLPDVAAIAAALTPRTKAVLLNSPNNPTGAIYPESVLRALADALAAAEKRFGTSIYVVSDEPYGEIVFDGATVPATLAIFRNLIVASSWSKSLALPGERIGFACVHPLAGDAKELLAAMAYAIRALGFINAPAIFQRVIERSIDARCDLASYVDRRARLLTVLSDAGFTCTPPQGALYLFVKSPEPDEVAFSARAAAHRVLVVPGVAFGYPGYFRLTYCVSMKTIEDSRASWNAIAAEYGLKR